jgi:hypothetical protein
LLRSFYAWLVMVLGAATIAIGTLLLTVRGEQQPHHDFAGPTDIPDAAIRLVAIGVIALGCAGVALGWWRRRTRDRLPDARVVRRD